MRFNVLYYKIHDGVEAYEKECCTGLRRNTNKTIQATERERNTTHVQRLPTKQQKLQRGRERETIRMCKDFVREPPPVNVPAPSRHYALHLCKVVPNLSLHGRTASPIAPTQQAEL